MKLTLTLSLVISTLFLFGQNPTKKTLGHEELVSWNRIRDAQISNDGNYVVYHLKPEEGNSTVKIFDGNKNATATLARADGAKISSDNRYVIFKIKADWDSLRQMKRKKVKKEDLPKDTLGIYDLQTQNLEKIANVKSFKLFEKWADWVVFHKDIEKPVKDTTAVDTLEMAEPDTLQTPKKKKKKVKKEGQKTGTKLVIRNLKNGEEEVIPFVKEYILPKEGTRVMAMSTGKDSTFLEGIYVFETKTGVLKAIIEQEAEYKNLTFDESGQHVAFHVNMDTTEMQVPPFGLGYWTSGMKTAKIIADTAATFLPEGWRVSENGKPSFSENGEKLFFGIAPQPILQDTSILEDEIVNVEVWSYEDAVLHTQQNSRLKDEKKRTYRAVWNIKDNQFVQLGSQDIPDIRTGDEGNADYVLGNNEAPYFKQFSWEGVVRKDLFLINTETGASKTVAKAIEGRTVFSPKAEFIYWYNELDTAWFAYEIKTEQLRQITNNKTVKFYNEIHDSPSPPWPYGIAGWTENDDYILINDRYDLWKVDPRGVEKAVKLTDGRAEKLRYRYIRLDPEERNIDLNDNLLLHVFDEKTKGGGYAYLTKKGVSMTPEFSDKFSYQRRPKKARDADKILYTRQNFQTFPDLHLVNSSFAYPVKISDANPQQADYSWGSIELYEWTDLNGNVLTGQLVKPENFDPNKQYPMLVNFYEKSSDRLHSYRTPLPGRSTINYPFYASKGYLIFNPDVPYRIGYPGESALNAVLSGVTSLIDKGFVNREKIGVQGHSWGGYQVAYLINRTDIFACAESGAPVVNMFSAYGGIRWGSGMSRMFQYEHTQSRIGGSIWEYPLRYLENSPIFTLDKCNTPVLILHNDKDGAVPWYQGIEYFVGLRRLNKPAWMLNYNDEPHWPVKLQNRKDFNVRMQQYFDHYLLDAPMPQWMKRGVPAIEKGILQGLETSDEVKD